MEYGYTYRLEEPKDYTATEALTREAFWNVYQPGCDEHFIVHSMRDNAAVIAELNYVCEDASGEIVGHIFYTRTKVIAEDGTIYPVISFGPISVHPDHQKRGIGSALIRMTLEKAAEMQFSGVLITGNPKYYHRFGFQEAAAYSIVSDDGSSFPELMACELGDHRLYPVHGRLYFCPEFADINQEELQRYDAQFPSKEKLRLPGQLF